MALGSRIPTAKRVINSVPPLNPSDFSEVNALNLMFIWDNMGTGEYLEDGAILSRHVDNLRAHEQASPNLTLAVDAGGAMFGITFVSFAGGNTPTITAPVSNPRIDLICFKSDGTVTRTAGTENASPVAPAVPAASIPLCSVYCVVGMTQVYDNDDQVGGQGYVLKDLRPFLGLGGSVIKSIQKGSAVVTLATTAEADGASAELTNATTVTVRGTGYHDNASNTASISSVDTTKAFVIYNGFSTGTGGGGVTTITVYFTVVEYL